MLEKSICALLYRNFNFNVIDITILLVVFQLHTPVVASITAKSPLREQQQTVGSNVSINGSQKGLISGEREPHYV